MWTVTATLLAGVLSLLLLFYRKRKKDLDLFKKMGIPGPEPHWLYGNLHQLHDPEPYLVLQKWTKQYKKLYGYYEGCRPVLVTADVDMIQEVFVRKHSYFNARKVFFFTVPDNSAFNHMLSAKGARWKRLRTIINPTFSALKLKQMLPLIEEKVNKLVDKLSEAANEGKPLNIMKFYQGLTLDVIADTAFGVKTESLSDPDEPFLVNCRKSIDTLNPEKRSFILTLARLFPELDRLLFRVFSVMMVTMKLPQMELLRTMADVIELREKERLKRTDLLQLMLDAKADDSITEEVLTMTSYDDHQQIPVEELTASDTLSEPKRSNSTQDQGISRKTLTVQEIKSQSYLFLLAGYETTSTALSYCTYLLSVYPDVQEKLLQEVDHYLPNETKATYEVLQRMSYLHMVLCETLRLYPLASFVVNRTCCESCTICGVYIPEGVAVQADVWSVHHDPDIWGKDVEYFIPERFSKEAMATRHPMAWMPFGVGPRNCVGLRFALLEAKLALAKILQKYTFEKCSEANDTLKLQDHGIVVPCNGVNVKIVPRRHQ